MKTNFERGQLNAQDDLNANFLEIEEFMNLPNLPEIYLSEGEEGSNATEGYRYRLGPIFAKANSQSLSDLPFTISSDRTTITILKDTVLNFSGVVKFHGAGSTDYAYCRLKKGTTGYDFANIGEPSGQTLNLHNGVFGQRTIAVKEGEVLNFELSVREGKNIFRTQLRSLVIKELLNTSV